MHLRTTFPTDPNSPAAGATTTAHKPKPAPARTAEPRLVFPAKALEQARSQNPHRPIRHAELAASIDATLDRMQSQLDQLKTDAQALRFPVELARSSTEGTSPDRPAA